MPAKKHFDLAPIWKTAIWAFAGDFSIIGYHISRGHQSRQTSKRSARQQGPYERAAVKLHCCLSLLKTFIARLATVETLQAPNLTMTSPRALGSSA